MLISRLFKVSWCECRFPSIPCKVILLMDWIVRLTLTAENYLSYKYFSTSLHSTHLLRETCLTFLHWKKMWDVCEDVLCACEKQNQVILAWNRVTVWSSLIGLLALLHVISQFITSAQWLLKKTSLRSHNDNDFLKYIPPKWCAVKYLSK